MIVKIDLNDDMSTPLGKLDYIDLNGTRQGIFKVIYKPNITTNGPEYFLIVSEIKNNLRVCRIYTDKPEYITGYDENCRLNKIEKNLLIKILTTDTINWNDIRKNIIGLDSDEKIEGFTGWEIFLNEHNSLKKGDYINKEDQYIMDKFTIPNYNLLEEE